MKNKIKFILLMIITTGQAFAAVTESARCRLRTDSLGSEQAQGRSAWAIKCFPDLAYQADEEGVFYLYDAQANKQLLGYPTFIKLDANGNSQGWIAPTDANAGCVDPRTHKHAGFCRAGCYTPDQMLLFSDGYRSIDGARQSLRSDIVSLAENSTIEKMRLQVSELKSYTVDPFEQKQKIAIIETEEGGGLQVTLDHPLVVSTGVIKEAHELKVGDQLITDDGLFAPIKSIEVVDYYGKVMNVEMNNQDLLDNIVVAQGYLNGSVMYQNTALKEVNRKILRQLIPESVL